MPGLQHAIRVIEDHVVRKVQCLLSDEHIRFLENALATLALWVGPRSGITNTLVPP